MNLGPIRMAFGVVAPPGSTGAGGSDARARAPATTSAPASRPPPPPSSNSPPSSAGAVLRAAVNEALGLQGGLAPLMADLAQSLQIADLPHAVADAAQAVLAGALTPDPPPTAAEIGDAFASSGLFLEARVAGGEPILASDVKAALLRLSQALDAASTSSPDPGAPARPPSTGGSTPPPVAGGPLVAQAAVAAGLSPNQPFAMVASRLKARTAAALARQTLAQAMALESDPGEEARGRPPAWRIDLPLAAPEGYAAAVLEISRDGARSPAGDDIERTWRAAFALDVAPPGRVQARLTLRGDRLRVGLWAEADASRQDLEGRRADLLLALQGEGLAVDVEVFSGRPAEGLSSSAGRLMDRAV